MDSSRNKEYVVVTNARRELIISSILHANKVEHQYRLGEIGLLHQAVLDFADNERNSDLEGQKRMEARITIHPEVRQKGELTLTNEEYSKFLTLVQKMPLGPSTPFFPSGHPYSDFDLRDRRSVLALSYERGIGKKGYFYMGLWEGEFERLKGIALEEVVKEVLDIYSKQGINFSESYARGDVEEKWKHLEAFDVLMQDKIKEIPFECSCRHLSDEILQSKRDFLRKMNMIDWTSRRIRQTA